MPEALIRHDWSRAEVAALFALPFNELLYRAHGVHRAHHDPNAVQVSTLLSIKTGGCPEDCAYCPQAQRYHTGVQAQKLLEVDEVLAKAKRAKAAGASRFCMGAAWRGPKDKDLEPVLDMVREVKKLGLQTCVTLGMLKEGQAERLAHGAQEHQTGEQDEKQHRGGQHGASFASSNVHAAGHPALCRLPRVPNHGRSVGAPSNATPLGRRRHSIRTSAVARAGPRALKKSMKPRLRKTAARPQARSVGKVGARLVFG